MYACLLICIVCMNVCTYVRMCVLYVCMYVCTVQCVHVRTCVDILYVFALKYIIYNVCTASLYCMCE